jgi:hypothetical protein
MNGMYLSFADETGFLGAVFIPEQDIVSAVQEAWRLGINPGGEVMGLGPGPMPPSEWVGRLLTREQVEEFDQIMLGEEDSSPESSTDGSTHGTS